MTGTILVVSSCTATKLPTRDGRPVCAQSLYVGQQHVRLMRGIREYREAGTPAGELRFRILSAFHGLVLPQSPISSYDHSFSGLSVAAIRRQSLEKNVPKDIRMLLRKAFGLGVLLLGDSYLRACDLDAKVELGGPLLCFCSPAAARRMPEISGLRTIPLANVQARRFSCGLTSLKGELARRLLLQLAAEPGALGIFSSPKTDILRRLEVCPGSALRRLQSIAA